MASTTLGVKVDDLLRSRLKDAATRLERTPHWLIKQAIFAYLERIEHGQLPPELSGANGVAELGETAPVESDEDGAAHPFLDFAQNVQPQSVLRAAITAAYRRPEPECVPFLVGQARLPAAIATETQALAAKLVEALRAKHTGGGVEGLIHEFSLSSQEGVALMCLAEALLRIPDRATRDALIRDQPVEIGFLERLRERRLREREGKTKRDGEPGESIHGSTPIVGGGCVLRSKHRSTLGWSRILAFGYPDRQGNTVRTSLSS